MSAVARETHLIQLALDAKAVAARTVGFLTAMLNSERLDPIHHDQARDILSQARAVMETPLFADKVNSVPGSLRNSPEAVSQGVK